ncbi:MAG: DUF2442 domain-containing protein [Steroidobacteraceae bacterium]
MVLTDADVRQAERRMRERMNAQARAVSARYDRRTARVVVGLNNGLELGVPVNLAQGLAGAKPSELAEIEISATGLGLHWPRLDADLYLPGLLNGVFGTRRWMARVLGQVGGQATSRAKQAAARANGRRGGRPRKEAHA